VVGGGPCNIVEVGGKRPRVPASAYIDPLARVMGDVRLGDDVVVLFGSILRGDDDRVTVGPRTVVLENSLVEAPRGKPVEIGEEVLVSHGAIIHGARVEARALVGIGAIVLDGATVGEEAIVAAGSLVPPGKTVPPRTLAMGVPAKPVRQLTEEDLAAVKRELEAVHRKAAEYRRALPRPC